MKNYLLSILLLFTTSVSYSQTINGRLVDYGTNLNPYDSTLSVTLQIKLNENENAMLGHAFNLKFDYNSSAVEFIQGIYVNFNEADGYQTSTITNPGNSNTIQNIETQLISGPGREVVDEYIDFVLFEFKVIDFTQQALVCPHNNSMGFHFYSPNSLQDWIIGEWLCYEPNTPVELTLFTATTRQNNVILNWATATELNNLGFEVEKKSADSDWEKIGFVNGHGTTTEHQSYNYIDMNLDNGIYCYRLKQVDFGGSYDYSKVVEVEVNELNSYLLEQNYPNPFNPITTIEFGIPKEVKVTLIIYDALGSEVETIVNEKLEPGYYKYHWNGSNYASGVYFYRIIADKFVSTKKIMLLK